tara:strand:- start:85 stop:318 length:234 start_codon:yes stop_codon:yes gene_type:complete
MTTGDELCLGFCGIILILTIFFYVVHRYIIYCIQDFSEYIHPARSEDTRNAWDDRNLRITRGLKNLKKALFGGEWNK